MTITEPRRRDESIDNDFEGFSDIFEQTEERNSPVQQPRKTTKPYRRELFPRSSIDEDNLTPEQMRITEPKGSPYSRNEETETLNDDYQTMDINQETEETSNEESIFTPSSTQSGTSTTAGTAGTKKQKKKK